MKKKSTPSTESFLRKQKNSLLFTFLFLFLGLNSLQSNAQCMASFNPMNDSINPAIVYFFDGSSTSAGTITSYQWIFGDGSVGTVQSPTHTYAVSGVYMVTLIIGTDLGCTDSISIAVSIPPFIDIFDFSADSSGTIFCTAPAYTDFILQGNTGGFGINDTVDVYIAFGDGTDTTFSLSIQQRYFFSSLQHIYVNAGTYNPIAIVNLGPVADTVYSTPITVNSNCGALAGTVYLDNNQDCIFNSGDVTLANISVSLSVAGTTLLWTQTDSNGVYSFNVPPGTNYDVTVHINNWYGGTYTVVCPVGGVITVSSIPSSGNDFFLTCPSGYDLTGSVYVSGVVPGRTGSVCVYAYDRFCSTPNGQIKVILDPLLTAIPDSSGGYTISGDTIIWNYTSASSYWSHCAQVVTSTTAMIGDTVCVTMIIEPVSGDANPADNIVTACAPVRTSYDPNDKAGEPYGQGANNAILPGTAITYTVRFQNTGTAEAYDIYILDTIDADLDMNSFEILASSHAMVPSILQDNVVRFTFSNIMLPDSNTNEPMSHGYVSYRISPRSGVADGAVINNTAGIYFDYNPAVITNTTLHTIDYTLGVKELSKGGSIRVMPNPANDKVFINLTDKGNCTVSLINMLGEIVYTSTNNKDQLLLSTIGIPAGIYLVRAENEKSVYQSKLIVSH